MNKIQDTPLVILAGGFGTRIMEYSHLIPKPMIEIGDQPIILHIMRYYSSFGVKKFIISAGYKSEIIKKYFSDINNFINDIEINTKNKTIDYLNKSKIDWTVKVIDTGLDTQTGGRIKNVEKYLEGENFFMTYGDGLSDVSIDKLYNFHKKNKKLATVTTVSPKSRFGILNFKKGNLVEFKEKPKEIKNFINAGFFVLNKRILNHILNSKTNFEQDVLTKLSKKNQLVGYKHNGFWQCMDTQRDKKLLDQLWISKKAPWITKRK